MSTGLFIFHRDFRIYDNITLNYMVKNCEEIYCCFIFNPEQVDNINEFKSQNSIQFMVNSLNDLSNYINDKGGTLNIFYGKPDVVIKDILSKNTIHIIGFNRDYTPFSKSREKTINDIVNDEKLQIIVKNDYYLYEPGSILVDSSQKAYTKFTPFYNMTKNYDYSKPTSLKKFNFIKSTLSSKYKFSLDEASKFFTNNPDILLLGSRDRALKILREIKNDKFKNYSKDRDQLNGYTTLLSGFIKFGCVSVRECADAFNKNDALYRQLIWREFYAHLLNYFPHVLKGPLKDKYSKIKWSRSKNNFDAWKNSSTGFPIVDAAMREINTTGYMHNRARLISASFLVKTLLINWQWGEKYFAQNLLDYDPASNNGNWQWVASTGADSQPYFRVFNPWTQSENFDKDCNYIKKWLPELNELPPKVIHNWYKYYSQYKHIVNYPEPIVDHSEKRLETIEAYKEIN